MEYLNNLKINKAMDNLDRFEALVTRLLLTTTTTRNVVSIVREW